MSIESLVVPGEDDGIGGVVRCPGYVNKYFKKYLRVKILTMTIELSHEIARKERSSWSWKLRTVRHKHVF